MFAGCCQGIRKENPFQQLDSSLWMWCCSLPCSFTTKCTEFFRNLSLLILFCQPYWSLHFLLHSLGGAFQVLCSYALPALQLKWPKCTRPPNCRAGGGNGRQTDRDNGPVLSRLSRQCSLRLHSEQCKVNESKGWFSRPALTAWLWRCVSQGSLLVPSSWVCFVLKYFRPF